MLNSPASTTHPLGRCLLTAPLVVALALSYAGAQAQTAPTTITLDRPAPQGPAPIYYIDGKRLEPLTTAELAGINPSDIDNISVLKDEQARKIDPTAGERGLVFITTKGRATAPDVVAFNQRINSLVVPRTHATAAQEKAIAAAMAYVTQNYPQAKLESVLIVKGQPDRYQAIFTEGGKRMQLLFDGNGQPVKQ